ncbi:MAG TPA: hypothetical protein VIN10_03595 [Bacteroidales bacterium]
MKKILLFTSLMFLIGYANAQDGNSKQPLFKVTSFSSSIGFAGVMTSNTDEDYYGLQKAVQNPSLFIDVSGFTNNSSYYGNYGFNGGYYYNGYGGGAGNGSAVFNLGLTPYSKKLGKYRENRELRISVGSNFGTRNTFDFYDNNTFRIDTFQSVNGSGIVYADSAIYSNYSYSLNFTSINFGVSYLFKTDMKRRVHFYAGGGVNYGIALNSTVDVYENIYKSVIYYNEYQNPSENDNNYYYYDGNNNGSYSYSNSSTSLIKPMQFVRFYIPVGLSLRLSNKETSFFNHVDLYTEMIPGVELQIISYDKTYANPYFGIAFIGFNYHW